MSYTPPSGDALTATWEGAAPAAPRRGDRVTARWLTKVYARADFPWVLTSAVRSRLGTTSTIRGLVSSRLPCRFDVAEFLSVASRLGTTSTIFTRVGKRLVCNQGSPPLVWSRLVAQSVNVKTIIRSRMAFHASLRQHVTSRLATTAAMPDRLTWADMADTISCSGSVRVTPVAAIGDYLMSADRTSHGVTLHQLLADDISFSSAAAAIVLALHSDNVTLTDTSSGSLEQIALMAELLACASGSTATVEIAASLMDLLAAREVLSYVQSATMDDALALADGLTAEINLLAYSSDFVALTERFQGGLIVLTGDALAAADATAANMNVLLSWHDAIACFTNLPLDDGNYTAWVMNAETTGMSRYTVPGLNSLFDHDGRVWGVSADGLWELAGDTDDDDPIDAWVKTGHFDFGTRHYKNLPRAYLYVKTTGEMALRVTSSDRGARTERTYPVHTHPAGDDEAGRIIPLARGLKGVYWQVEIANTDGCDFEIAGCEVYPVILSRRGQ